MRPWLGDMDMFRRFNKTFTCDGRTDGQTDGHRVVAYRPTASRGKLA